MAKTEGNKAKSKSHEDKMILKEDTTRGRKSEQRL